MKSANWGQVELLSKTHSSEQARVKPQCKAGGKGKIMAPHAL